MALFIMPVLLDSGSGKPNKPIMVEGDLELNLLVLLTTYLST